MFKNEREFVRWLQRRAAGRSAGVRLGVGDDAALVEVRKGHEIILTSDLSIEGVHFQSGLHPPEAVGHRALARSLSDVAAMGGTPLYALISLAISQHTTQAWLEGFYAGAFALARRFSVTVVGGDTSIVADRITIDVTVVGEIQRGKAVRRSGAMPGDLIYVSGWLGLAALGLLSIQAKPRLAQAGRKMKDAVHAHLFPEPRCALGRFLSERNLASSLIDLSDGLSTDLDRLCDAGRVGARVWEDQIPVPINPQSEGLSPACALDLALNGGEDYELLFTVSPRKATQIPREFQGVHLHWIGEICRPKKILLALPNGKEAILKPSGYDHFEKVNSSRENRRKIQA